MGFVIFVGIALNPIDHDDFHILKFRQICAARATTKDSEFRMILFTKFGIYISMYLSAERRQEIKDNCQLLVETDGFNDVNVFEWQQRHPRMALFPGCAISANDTIIVDNDANVCQCLVRVSTLCAFDSQYARNFIVQVNSERCCTSPTLVIAAHGHGNAINCSRRFSRFPYNKFIIESDDIDRDIYVNIDIRTFVDTILAGFQFQCALLDSCLMSTLEAASAFASVTRYVIACQGYMWEEDNEVEKHVLNSISAALLLSFSAACQVDLINMMKSILLKFSHVSGRGDISILHTRSCLDLYLYLLEIKPQLMPLLKWRLDYRSHYLIDDDSLLSPIDKSDSAGDRLYDVMCLIERYHNEVSLSSMNLSETSYQHVSALLSAAVVARQGVADGADYYGTSLNGLSLFI